MKKEKSCIVCGQVFYGRSIDKYCLRVECQRERRLKDGHNYYQRHRETLKQKSCENYWKDPKSRSQKHRSLKLKALQLVSHSENPVCLKCHCSNLDILELAHINHDGKFEDGRTHLIAKVARNQRPPEGLKVLCKLCNQLEDIENRFHEYGFIIKWNPSKFLSEQPILEVQED